MTNNTTNNCTLNNEQWTVEAIRIDLPRTFPENVFFENIRTPLFNVLVAYANHNKVNFIFYTMYNMYMQCNKFLLIFANTNKCINVIFPLFPNWFKEIGYCQGLNFIAGTQFHFSICIFFSSLSFSLSLTFQFEIKIDFFPLSLSISPFFQSVWRPDIDCNKKRRMDILVIENFDWRNHSIVSYKNNERFNHWHRCIAWTIGPTGTGNWTSFGWYWYAICGCRNQMVYLYVCRGITSRNGATCLGLSFPGRQQGLNNEILFHIHIVYFIYHWQLNQISQTQIFCFLFNFIAADPLSNEYDLIASAYRWNIGLWWY